MLHITNIMGKKITKTLAAVVLLVILGYFGGTWYSGTKVDEQVIRRTQDINAQLRSSGLPVQVTSEKKDAGLFSSTYTLTLRIDNAGQSHSLDFNVQVEHGPLPLSRLQQGKLEPVRALSHVTLINNEKTSRLFELSQGQPPLELLLTTHLDGQTRYRGRVASLAFNNTRDGQLHFDGMAFEGTVDATNQVARFSGNMPLIQVTPPTTENATSTLIFRDLAMSSHYDGRDTENPLWRQQSTLAAFSLASDNAKLEIDQYQTDSKADTQDSLLALQQNTVLNQVRINGTDLGKLQYTVAASGLDRAGAMQFITQAWQQLLNAGQRSDQTVPQQQQMALLASLDQMLSGKPELTVGPITWTLPEGSATASINMALNNPVPLLSQLGNDPYALLLNALRSVRVQLQADQAIPQGAADRISQLGAGALPSPGSTTEPTAAEKLDTIIDILVRNQLLYRKQDLIGLNVNIEGNPSLASAGAVEMNGEQYDPVGFVSALQTRAAAAELQIRQLTPPPPPASQQAPEQEAPEQEAPEQQVPEQEDPRQD
ncbi:YdgA family protein [Advenella kashmirensis]